MKNRILTAAALLLALSACKSKSETPHTPPVLRKEKSDTAHAKQKGPVINVADTIEIKRTILYVKDSAATATGLSLKLSNLFNKRIPDALKAAHLTMAGEPMAWYKTQKAPYFFEAGVPVEKAVGKTPKGFLIRTIGGDSALVAHFFGPIDMIPAAYDALNGLLQDRSKEKGAPAYEIYVKNPFVQTKEKRDPYKSETDVVMPYK